MAWRYWVTETVQTFDNKGVRLYKQETVMTFDTLIEAAEHANTAMRVRPVAAGVEITATRRVVIEGQEINDAVRPACGEPAVVEADLGVEIPAESFPPPVLHKCPNCGSSTVYFYDARVDTKMYCSACGKTFMADDGTVL